MSLLGTLGLWSLALGAVSGWLVAASIERPELLRRARIKHLARVRQTHLDWIMMGLLLLVVDVAVDDIPAWIQVLIAFGTVVNPLLFIPLAYDAQASSKPAYRAVTFVSFAALSVGLPALAVHATIL
jgi:hydroxylaminobenzene mutase